MSAVPQGAFASLKIKQNARKRKGELKTEFANRHESLLDDPPLKYSSKLMNSVWGLYNRYSAHNLKKNADSVGLKVFSEQQYRA